MPTQNEQFVAAVNVIVGSGIAKLRGPLRTLLDLAQNPAQHGGASDETISESRWYQLRTIVDALDQIDAAIDPDDILDGLDVLDDTVDAVREKIALKEALDFVVDNEFGRPDPGGPHGTGQPSCLDCGAEPGQAHSEKCRWLFVMRLGGRR